MGSGKGGFVFLEEWHEGEQERREQRELVREEGWNYLTLSLLLSTRNLY